MFTQFRKINYGEQLFVGCDTSYGVNDYCVAQFYSKTMLDVPLIWRAKKIAPEMTTAIWQVLERIADTTGWKPVVAYERNNGGGFEMERLASLNRQGKYTIFQMPTIGNLVAYDTPKLGWDTNSATRPEMLTTLKLAIDKSNIKIYDKITINELFSFIVVRTTSSVKAQAERNSHDDHVMSLAIALKLAEMEQAIKLHGNIHLSSPTYSRGNIRRHR